MFKVIVKDGRTQNLNQNTWAVNGDLEGSMFGPSKSTPLLEDGEYDANGFEFVLQMDDSKNVWVMAPDERAAIRNGWPTRHSLYFFKDNLSSPHMKTPYIKYGVKSVPAPKPQSTQVNLSNIASEAWQGLADIEILIDENFNIISGNVKLNEA